MIINELFIEFSFCSLCVPVVTSSLSQTHELIAMSL